MPQDKLTAVRVKRENGEYGPQIPVTAKAENVEYNEEYSVKDIIGDVNIIKGPLQQQIENINTQDVQNWIKDNLNFTAPVAQYDSSTTYNAGDIVIYENSFYRCKQNDTVGETPDSESNYWDQLSNFAIDESLSVEGVAADAYQAGRVVTINNEEDGNATKLHLNTTEDTVSIATMDDISMLTPPNENGVYNLQVTVNDNVVTYSWNKIS